MKKSEFIANMANAAGMSKDEATRALSAFMECMTDAMKADESVSLTGFGTFSAKHRAARQGRNPATGATIQIAAKTVAAFKASKSLNESLNESTSSSSDMGNTWSAESSSGEAQSDEPSDAANDPWKRDY